jgi:hypothetical protein
MTRRILFLAAVLAAPIAAADATLAAVVQPGKILTSSVTGSRPGCTGIACQGVKYIP